MYWMCKVIFFIRNDKENKKKSVQEIKEIQNIRQ